MWQIVITKWIRYHKVWKTLLVRASGITKTESFWKVRGNKVISTVYDILENLQRNHSLNIHWLPNIFLKTDFSVGI